ncbi:glycerol dehydrogenase [Brenneria corticis]|uniref:Glycerol dehydrogenase n=1 Tax=Brenneria corticis TaxID=2173106 RepID=A0A2U1UA31_9GAMM|nr:glycerol dehydrogenase [Brenneria sp. CFCC 11842]PWC18520.1 glycerol dehydrogenase [Brenneria sp. CFCC 11842]
MSNIPRTNTSPKKFLIGAGLLESLHEYVRDFGDNAFIISGGSMIERVKNTSLIALRQAGLQGSAVKFSKECSAAEIERLGALANARNANVIVGIGGGKALDAAKATAYYQKLPVILYPTVASSDAPCTSLAVLYTEKGEFDRYLYLPHNPDVVIADTAILAAAPAHFFSAGIGDALATYFESRACYRADGLNLVLKKPSRTGLGLSQLCYQLLSENVEAAMNAVRGKVVTSELEQTIEATIYLSGVGAESGGLAAAHAINNGMSIIDDLHDAQHGEKVAFGLLAQLVLEEAPDKELDEVIRIIKTAELPLTLQEMGLKNFVEAEWRQVAERACSEDDTMGNMPEKVTQDDVYRAIVAANNLAERYRVAH